MKASYWVLWFEPEAHRSQCCGPVTLVDTYVAIDATKYTFKGAQPVVIPWKKLPAGHFHTTLMAWSPNLYKHFHLECDEVFF